MTKQQKTVYLAHGLGDIFLQLSVNDWTPLRLLLSGEGYEVCYLRQKTSPVPPLGVLSFFEDFGIPFSTEVIHHSDYWPDNLQLSYHVAPPSLSSFLPYYPESSGRQCVLHPGAGDTDREMWYHDFLRVLEVGRAAGIKTLVIGSPRERLQTPLPMTGMWFFDSRRLGWKWLFSLFLSKPDHFVGTFSCFHILCHLLSPETRQLVILPEWVERSHRETRHGVGLRSENVSTVHPSTGLAVHRALLLLMGLTPDRASSAPSYAGTVEYLENKIRDMETRILDLQSHLSGNKIAS